MSGVEVARGIARFLGGAALGRCGYYGPPPNADQPSMPIQAPLPSTSPDTTHKLLFCVKKKLTLPDPLNILHYMVLTWESH